MLSAVELYDRGQKAVFAGRHSRGTWWLSQALARSTDSDLCARIILTQAYSASERGSTGDGLAMLDRVASDGLSLEVRGLLAGQRALLLMRSGEAGGALAASDRALAFLAGQGVHRAWALLNRGNVHLQRRALRLAGADFAAAAEAVGDGDAVTGALATHNLGYVELLAGRLPEALRAMDSARPTIVAQRSAVDEAVADADRAQVLVSAGLTHEADTTLARVAATFGRQRLRQSQAEAELSRAELLLATRRPEESARLARTAAARFRRRGASTWALRAEALAFIARISIGRVRATAVADGLALGDALQAGGLREESRRLRLHCVRAALDRGDHTTARGLAGATRVPGTAPITTRLLARSVRAELSLAGGRHADAGRHLRAGLAELFAWQASFGSLDLQTGVASHGRALAVRGLRLAVDDGRPQVVFDWTERARAFASRVLPVRPPEDAEAAAVLGELRQLRLEAGLRPDALTRRRMTELERRIRDRALYSVGPRMSTEPLTLTDLQAMLAPGGGTLVSHFVIDGRLHALTADGERATVHELGELADVMGHLDRVARDLDAAATSLPVPIRAAVTASLRAGIGELEQLLWRPLVEVGAPGTDGPLLLVPSAALASVPWTLLPALSGRPVGVARTATSWAHNRSPHDPVEHVALVAGPDVPRAVEEVSRAAEAWADARQAGPEDATAAAVTRLASQVDLLHVAAHGTHSADNPLFSALALADGPWFGYDIAAVSPVPAHVVLSACELGRSSVRSGEETLGMTAAWQHAGARTVVASAVRVNDDSACEVLAAHHAAMAAGATPAAALARATSALPPDAPPAPFVCFGAGW